MFKQLTPEQVTLLFKRARKWAAQGARSKWNTTASTDLWDVVKNLEEATITEPKSRTG